MKAEGEEEKEEYKKAEGREVRRWIWGRRRIEKRRSIQRRLLVP